MLHDLRSTRVHQHALRLKERQRGELGLIRIPQRRAQIIDLAQWLATRSFGCAPCSVAPLVLEVLEDQVGEVVAFQLLGLRDGGSSL